MLHDNSVGGLTDRVIARDQSSVLRSEKTALFYPDGFPRKLGR